MPSPSQWTFGPFRLDTANACLWRGEQMLALRPKAFAVLVYLVTHGGQLVTKEALFDAVWPGAAVSDTVLKACISQLRRMLGETVEIPQCIATVHGRGYRFIAPVTAVDQPATTPVASAPPLAALSSLQLQSASLSPPLSSPLLVEREAVLRQLHTWLAEAMAVMERTGEHSWEAEVYRLKGECLLAQEGHRLQAPGPRAIEAEGHFQQALAIAQQQSARSLELRAAMSLSRLWQQQGKRDDARRLLTDVYSWFTEGCDTTDLQAAKELLATRV